MVSRSHPRYLSLMQRHRLVDGLKAGFVTESGLIAHGRGEAYDYLLGEKTVGGAARAERAAAAMLLLAEKPIVSVNGNTAALVPRELVELAETVDAKLEVNLFYWTPKREKLVAKELRKAGAKKVYGLSQKRKMIPGLKGNRGRVDPDGIWMADVVLVSIEDGDRTEALIRNGKKVIAIDLNPLSRTSRKADITVVDNIVRAVPNIIDYAKKLKMKNRRSLEEIVKNFDNKWCLGDVAKRIRAGV